MSFKGPLRRALSGTDRTSTANSHHPRGPQLTRLQREARTLVALDVEYAHILAVHSGARIQLPAEVCLVDWQGDVLVQLPCDGLAEHGLPQHGDATDVWRFTGGVPPRLWRGGPSLVEVRSHLRAAMHGRPVVGHNLGKDLAAMGLEGTVPAPLRRDTMRYAALQGPKGTGRALAELAYKKLAGRRIQQTAVHNPHEDAVAALDLYLKYCHYDTALMSYEDLVEHWAAELIANGPSDAPQV